MIRPAQLAGVVIVGVILVATGYWLAAGREGGSAAAQAQVLPLKQAELNAVTGVKIFKGDNSHATLTREGARWMVTERGYPADTGQVRKLLLDVAALQVEELKTTDTALYARLGVEDPTSVQATSTGLTIDSGGRTLGLIVGKTSGTRAVFVRVAGTPQSLLATPQLAPDADPRHWLDRSILDVTPDQIAQVAVQPKTGPAFLIKRAAPGADPEFSVSPIPPGRALGDPAGPGAQASALAGLQLDDVRRAAGDPVAAHSTFQTGDGLSLAISGIEHGETRYLSVAASATAPAAQQRAQELNARLSGWEFEVPGYRYDALFRPLEQLLKPKPTAAPAAGKPQLPAAGAPARLPFGPGGASGATTGKATPEQSR